jgi:hypothetical protein
MCPSPSCARSGQGQRSIAAGWSASLGSQHALAAHLSAAIWDRPVTGGVQKHPQLGATPTRRACNSPAPPDATTPQDIPNWCHHPSGHSHLVPPPFRYKQGIPGQQRDPQRLRPRQTVQRVRRAVGGADVDRAVVGGLPQRLWQKK